MESNEINVYCDESCHLENEQEHCMLVSCICCPKKQVSKISDELRKLKEKHGIWRYAELKWTKVSKSKEEYYTDLIEYFIKNKYLLFRTIIIPHKEKLNHRGWNQTHSAWYYKMIYTLVKYIPEYIYSRSDKFNVYIDKKENSYEARVELLKLKEYLGAHFQSDFVVQNIVSNQSELLQLNDFIQGAVSYYNRGIYSKEGTSAKNKIVTILSEKMQLNLARKNSNKKFNIFIWEAQ